MPQTCPRLLIQSLLFIVGGFRELAGVTRHYVAALPWRSDAGNWVFSVDGDRLHAGEIATAFGAVEGKSLSERPLQPGWSVYHSPGTGGDRVLPLVGRTLSLAMQS